jgi:hypothetical protein
MTKRNWQLMTVDEIAQLLIKLEQQGNTTPFRVQKSYYKTSNNTVMLQKLEMAEALVKSIRDSIRALPSESKD